MLKSTVMAILLGIAVTSHTAFAQSIPNGEERDAVPVSAASSASEASDERSTQGTPEDASRDVAPSDERTLGNEPDDDAPGYPLNG